MLQNVSRSCKSPPPIVLEKSEFLLFISMCEDFISLTLVQSAKWAVKPIELSPLQCSRYGWMNVDNDCLLCVSCKASIDASLPDDWGHETCEYCSQVLDHKHCCKNL